MRMVVATLAMLLGALTLATAPLAQSDPPSPGSSKSDDRPTLTAEDISRRMLTLIDSLTSNDDITPERVAKVIGINLISPVEWREEWTDTTGAKQTRRGSDPTGAAASVQLTPPWVYAIQIYRYPPERTRRRLDHALIPGTTANTDADMTPVCAVDLDAHAAALKSMGFSEETIYGSHGRVDGKLFSRNAITVRMYPGHRPNQADRACVRMMLVE